MNDPPKHKAKIAPKEAEIVRHRKLVVLFIEWLLFGLKEKNFQT